MARTKRAVKKGTRPPPASTKTYPLLFGDSGKYVRLQWPSNETSDYTEAREAFISDTLGCSRDEWVVYDEIWVTEKGTGQQHVSCFYRYDNKHLFLHEFYDGDDRLYTLPMNAREAFNRLFAAE